MAKISAAEVKKLRDATGAGMMAAKRALEEADGDFDRAVEILRIKGETKVKERGAERTASNGLVAAADGAMIQLNCETDFVAKNEQFQQPRQLTPRRPTPAPPATPRPRAPARPEPLLPAGRPPERPAACPGAPRPTRQESETAYPWRTSPPQRSRSSATPRAPA